MKREASVSSNCLKRRTGGRQSDSTPLGRQELVEKKVLGDEKADGFRGSRLDNFDVADPACDSRVDWGGASRADRADNPIMLGYDNSCRHLLLRFGLRPSQPKRLHELRIGVQRLGLTAYAGNPPQHAGAPGAVMGGGEGKQPIDAQRPPTVDPFRDVPTRDQAALAVRDDCNRGIVLVSDFDLGFQGVGAGLQRRRRAGNRRAVLKAANIVSRRKLGIVFNEFWK